MSGADQYSHLTREYSIGVSRPGLVKRFTCRGTVGFSEYSG